MHVIGTAGHVDHGKSALIAALTGTNPDRLLEEQIRGMTLDLGFAHLRFDDGVEAGIVDVPGHERFLHNMLAGAAGMELLLLVVDANEGAMPQTIEHLQILQFLNVSRVVVAANKIDLIEPRDREAALGRLAEQLRGTIAEGAPIHAVSATTGENLDALKAALHDALAAMAPRNESAPVYLPIDRAFTLTGLGTVVTGTLMQGTIGAGDSLLLEPSGTPAHVRSIGVFASRKRRVGAGSRVALNLPGIDRRAIRRGQAIVGRELSARRSFGVRFQPLRDAIPLLRRRTPVRAYVGSAEILGTLVMDEPIAATEVRARLNLREEVVAFSGLRFVLRRPSPMTLLGGGFVEDIESAVPDDGRDPNEDAVLGVLRARKLEPSTRKEIASGANVREDAADAALTHLVEAGDAIRVERPAAYVDAEAAQGLFVSVAAHLDDAHRAEPWAMGETSIALTRATGVPETALVRILEHFVADGRLVNRSGYYAAVDFHPTLDPQQRAFFEYLLPLDDAQPLLPIPFAGAAAAVRRSQVAGVAKAFDTLLAQGVLVKIGDDLYRGSQIAQIRARLATHFAEHPRMTAAEFRDLLGTSRKYAVPLLEWLDTHDVTIRDGDYRTLRKRETKQ